MTETTVDVQIPRGLPGDAADGLLAERCAWPAIVEECGIPLDVPGPSVLARPDKCHLHRTGAEGQGGARYAE